MIASNETIRNTAQPRGLEASPARPLRRPSFRLSDIWKAPLHGFPIQDEVVYQYLPLSEEMDVLEIGPGSGFTAFRLARRVRSLTILDVTKENIARLRDTLEPIPNLTFVRADVCAPGLSQVVRSRFDAIVGVQVFDSLPDPRACLLNLADFLRPGGQLLLQFQNFSPPITPLRTFFRVREELDQLLHAAGFQSWEVYALRLRPLARTIYELYNRHLPASRRLGSCSGQERGLTYEQSWLFQHQKRLEPYKALFNVTWTLLFAALRVAGDCFDRVPLGVEILNRNLLLLARR